MEQLEFTTSTAYQAYYWASFVVTLLSLMSYDKLKEKTPDSPFDNVGGNLLIALMGFIFWPLALTAFLKRKKIKSENLKHVIPIK